jgi:flagellar biosynthesis protein FlhG
MGDQAEQLRAEALKKSFHNQAPIARPLSRQCRVLTITSGKGGVGKTSLVLNLGLALIRIGYKVVVIDADLGLANIDVMINSIPRYNLIDVVSGEKKLRDIMVKGPLDLKIIPGGSGLFDLANIDQAKRGNITRPNE